MGSTKLFNKKFTKRLTCPKMIIEFSGDGAYSQEAVYRVAAFAAAAGA